MSGDPTGAVWSVARGAATATRRRVKHRCCAVRSVAEGAATATRRKGAGRTVATITVSCYARSAVLTR